MSLKQKKKVLFIKGLEQKLNYDYILQEYDLHIEEITVIESNEVARIQPFGDLIRVILIQVYEKKIEEIFIVENQTVPRISQQILTEMEQILGLRQKITTVNYLFDHCKTEFPNRTINDWIVGTEESMEGKQNPIEILRTHPLMPTSINITLGNELCVL